VFGKSEKDINVYRLERNDLRIRSSHGLTSEAMKREVHGVEVGRILLDNSGSVEVISDHYFFNEEFELVANGIRELNYKVSYESCFDWFCLLKNELFFLFFLYYYSKAYKSQV